MAANTGASIPLGRHGEGTQSISVVLLFEAFLNSLLTSTYGQFSEPILALEEPEAHLHPSAARCVWPILAGMRGQKIIATHSGDILGDVPLGSIRRFHRRDGRITVSQIANGTLDHDERRKLGYHVQASKGELLFARCWLIVEGETDYWVLKHTARVLHIDIERAGIRIVTFSNSDAKVLAKVANDLGISWHFVLDGDREGQNYRRSILPYLVGRTEIEAVTVLPDDNIEHLLCRAGFGSVFEAHISPQKRVSLTAQPGDPNYWSQVLSCRDNTPKPLVALEVMDEMNRQGQATVPAILSEVLNRVVELAGR